jgi:hypothetical protein
MAENSYQIGSLESSIKKDDVDSLYDKINPKDLKERIGNAFRQMIDRK